MSTALDAVGQSTEAGLRRRRIRAEVYRVAVDGSVNRVIGAVVSGTIEAGEPSRLGTGLIDVTVDSDPRVRFSSGQRGFGSRHPLGPRHPLGSRHPLVWQRFRSNVVRPGPWSRGR
jgi:hypothetical protein